MTRKQVIEAVVILEKIDDLSATLELLRKTWQSGSRRDKIECVARVLTSVPDETLDQCLRDQSQGLQNAIRDREIRLRHLGVKIELRDKS